VQKSSRTEPSFSSRPRPETNVEISVFLDWHDSICRITQLNTWSSYSRVSYHEGRLIQAVLQNSSDLAVWRQNFVVREMTIRKSLAVRETLLADKILQLDVRSIDSVLEWQPQSKLHEFDWRDGNAWSSSVNHSQLWMWSAMNGPFTSISQDNMLLPKG
jgi:hypothetical protein